MIKDLPGYRYQPESGASYEVPAWLCSCREEAEYKIVMMGRHPLWVFCYIQSKEGVVVYGIRRS